MKLPVPLAAHNLTTLPDLKDLDDVVFDTPGLASEEHKESLPKLVWNRINKAKSV